MTTGKEVPERGGVLRLEVLSDVEGLETSSDQLGFEG